MAFRAKNWPAAEQWFTRAAASASRDVNPHKWLGMTYAAQEKFLAAEPPFTRACTLSPADPDACYYLGRTLYSLGRFEPALAAYRKGPQTKRTQLGIALALAALNRDAEAEQAFQTAIAAGEEQAVADYERFRRMRGAAVLPSPEIRFEPQDLPFTVRNAAAGERRLPETMIAGVAILDYDRDGRPDIFISNGAALPSLRKTGVTYSNGLLRNLGDGKFVNAATQAGVAGEGYSMGAASADFDNDGAPDLFVTGVRGNHLYRNRGNGTFEEITQQAGVGGDGGWSVAAAWFDYDNDGLVDLFVVRYLNWDPAREPYCGTREFRQYCHPREYEGLSNLLYRNRGHGRFEDVSQASGISAHRGKGMGVAVGDYDRDGRLDIFVGNDSVPNFLFHNSGSGKFEEVALTAGVAVNEDGAAVSSMGAEFRDYDNDGHEDLWITALSNEAFPLFRNNGRGAFNDATLASGVARASLPWSGWSNAIADFNNDGWKDLFAAGGHVMDNAELSSGSQSRQPNLLLTNGHVGFAGRVLPGNAFHRGLAAADFDQDGRVDLVVTRLNEPAQILWNRTPRAGNWIDLQLQGVSSNRDAIGAWVNVGQRWDRVPASAGYGASPSRILHFGLGSETAVPRVEIMWPSGRTQVLSNPEIRRTVRVVEATPALR